MPRRLPPLAVVAVLGGVPHLRTYLPPADFYRISPRGDAIAMDVNITALSH